MRIHALSAGLVLGFLAPVTAQEDADLTPFERAQRQARKLDSWAPHRSIKVLYAGKEGGHRYKVFPAFLRKHFDKVGTLPLAQLSMRSAKDFDVVVVDWVSQYGCDGYEKRKGRLFAAPIKLGPDFTKPMVAMSYVSSQVRSAYKLDWL